LAQDNQGNTALMWAEKEGNTEIIELLKEVGAKE
jgi:ankyrin repeat protein